MSDWLAMIKQLRTKVDVNLLGLSNWHDVRVLQAQDTRRWTWARLPRRWARCTWRSLIGRNSPSRHNTPRARPSWWRATTSVPTPVRLTTTLRTGNYQRETLLKALNKPPHTLLPPSIEFIKQCLLKIRVDSLLMSYFSENSIIFYCKNIFQKSVSSFQSLIHSIFVSSFVIILTIFSLEKK